MTNSQVEPHDNLNLFACADEDGYSVRVLNRDTGVDYHTGETIGMDRIVTSFDGSRVHTITIDREKYRLNYITENETFYFETFDHFKTKQIPLDEMDRIEFTLDTDQLDQDQQAQKRINRVNEAALTMDKAIVVVEYGMHESPGYTLVDADILDGYLEAEGDPEAQAQALPDFIFDPDHNEYAQSREEAKDQLTGPNALPGLIGMLSEAKHNEDQHAMGRIERCADVVDVHETLNEHDIELIDTEEYVRG